MTGDPPIAMSAPDLEPEDVEAVVAVLRSGRLACGPRAAEFEARLAEYVGVGHAVAVNSGTAALHLIVRGLGLGPGDEVLVPSLTFCATVNAVLYERAVPVFADVDPATLTLSPADARRRITPRTRAILAVDLFGHPAAWDDLAELARDHDLRLIDDSCEALGAELAGRKIGSFGDAAAFAFYPNKQITTGEGGMLVTDDAGLAERARAWSNQGRAAMGGSLIHQHLGYNYRLDEMSAALGVTQLGRLEATIARRERVAESYARRLDGLARAHPLPVRPDARCSWFAYAILLDENVDRDRLMASLESSGVPSRAYFDPVHRQPYMLRRLDCRPDLPVTDSLSGRTLALPFHAKLTEDEIDRVVGALATALGVRAPDGPTANGRRSGPGRDDR